MINLVHFALFWFITHVPSFGFYDEFDLFDIVLVLHYKCTFSVLRLLLSVIISCR